MDGVDLVLTKTLSLMPGSCDRCTNDFGSTTPNTHVMNTTRTINVLARNSTTHTLEVRL